MSMQLEFVSFFTKLRAFYFKTRLTSGERIHV